MVQMEIEPEIQDHITLIISGLIQLEKQCKQYTDNNHATIWKYVIDEITQAKQNITNIKDGNIPIEKDYKNKK